MDTIVYSIAPRKGGNGNIYPDLIPEIIYLGPEKSY